jgi:hypothetical protein
MKYPSGSREKVSSANALVRRSSEPNRRFIKSLHATNMSTKINKTECILFFRDSHWDKGLSPEETQDALGQFVSWMEELSQRGIFKAGQPLEREGKLVSGKKGRNVADGPYVESKEAVGGYFLLQVDDLDEAVQIARTCPLLEFGTLIEVRPVAEVCPTIRRINAELAGATA